MKKINGQKIRILTAVLIALLAIIGCILFYSPPEPEILPKNNKTLDNLAGVFGIATSGPIHLSLATKKKNCMLRNALPDSECTPGAIFPEKTAEEICEQGYTKTVRNVSISLKKKVYAIYGIKYPQPTGSYEADHFIPLELGGSNEISNLFPESASPAPGFKEKDLVENYLHAEMCAGRISLGEAQGLIVNDWVKIYESLTPEEIANLKRQFKSWAN